MATEHADISFLLVGKTGVGKSSLGNAILQQKIFFTDPSTTSVTRNISFAMSEFKGRKLKVVDMIGMQDTRMSMNESTQLFLQQMEEAMSVTTGAFHVFLLVLRYGPRFTREDFETVQLLKTAFGPDFVRQNCIVVMSGGDIFMEEEFKELGLTFDAWCRMQVGQFKDLMEECEYRVLVFDNLTKEESTRQAQTEKLLGMVSDLQAKGHTYTDRDFALSQLARERISVELREAEVRASVLREESLILQELDASRFDVRNLRLLFMRSESLMRHVKGKDRGSGVLHYLMERVAALRSTVEQAVRSYSSVNEWRQRMQEREQDMEQEVKMQREFFAQQLALLKSMQEERMDMHGDFEPKR